MPMTIARLIAVLDEHDILQEYTTGLLAEVRWIIDEDVATPKERLDRVNAVLLRVPPPASIVCRVERMWIERNASRNAFMRDYMARKRARQGKKPKAAAGVAHYQQTIAKHMQAAEADSPQDPQVGVGLYCPVCAKPQFIGLAGPICDMGHSGVQGVKKEDFGKAPDVGDIFGGGQT